MIHEFDFYFSYRFIQTRDKFQTLAFIKITPPGTHIQGVQRCHCRLVVEKRSKRHDLKKKANFDSIQKKIHASANFNVSVMSR